MTDNGSAALAATVRRLRLRAGLSQEALAKRAGLMVNTIGALERGLRRRLYPHTARALADALGLTDAEQTALVALASGRTTSGTDPQPAPATPTHDMSYSVSLPAALTSFVGREREIVAAGLLLAGGRRLLTLTGPGGAGKTRLAVEGARAVAHNFPDGVTFVDLAPLADLRLVPQTVVTALGLVETAGRSSTEQIVAALDGRRALLLLDNCEHLLDACAALVSTLRRSCPGLTIVATSREPLAVSGEQVYPVPPLPLPPADLPATTADEVATLSGYAAVRLFVARATAVRPDFALTAANAAVVAEVCRRLDGLPLAIELAAARVRVLAPEGIVARLDDRFRLLSVGSRTAPSRQQTLRATIEWSHDLLTEPERVLFRRLSVFTGGWTLEAAEAVCREQGTGNREQAGAGTVPSAFPVPSSDVLDLLTALVDKSLVVADVRTESGRYSMLESIREYAAQNLAAAGETAAVCARHGAWYLALAEQAAPALRGAAQAAWWGRLEREQDNLRAALAWYEGAAGGGDPALWLAGALASLWFQRGYASEARQSLERALARTDAAGGSVARARALCHAGNLAYVQGDHGAGRALIEASAAMAREVGDTWGLAWILGCLGNVTLNQGDEAVARSLYEESLAHFRQAGDSWGIALQLASLGYIAAGQGDYADARSRLEEGLARLRAVGDDDQAAFVLRNLGYVAHHEGDDRRAAALFAESLTLNQQLGERRGVAACLAALGGLAGTQGRPERAARLFGATRVLLDAIGAAQLLPHDQAILERNLATVRAELGEEAFVAAWADGLALDADAAFTLARSGLDRTIGAGGGQTATTEAPRPVDVARGGERPRGHACHD